MQTHRLEQGTADWHAHRARHFNASDCPAMLGCSPYTSRAALLHQMATGIAPEVDGVTQRRFDDGHRFEVLARALAKVIVGEDLYPIVGSEGELSASFDGLTMDEETAFEHKSLNDSLRYTPWDQGNGWHLPRHYQVQMEQQLMVSGADRVLFMASKWTPSGELVEERHCWYASDSKLRAEILAGWRQFAQDLKDYAPPAAGKVEKIIAEPVEALPAPVVQVTGQLVLQDNFKVFEERLRFFLAEKLIRKPLTDEDFVNLDAQIKTMKTAREALKSAETQMLAQVQPVDQAKKTKDMLDKLLQQACSAAEDTLKLEKERRKGEIVAGGIKALADHVAALNKRLGANYMPEVPANFGAATHGLKSLKSMDDKVSSVLTTAKIAASAIADRIDANLKALPGLAGDRTGLTPDLAQLVLKAPDDFAAAVGLRVQTQKEAEERRAAALAEQQREKIRAEEEERANQQARDRQETEDALIRSIEAESNRIEADTVPYIQKAIGAFKTATAGLENDPRPRVAAAAGAGWRHLSERLEAAERRQREEAEAAQRAAAAPAVTPAPPPAATAAPTPAPTAATATVHQMQPRAPAAAPTLSISAINDRLKFCTVTAANLSALGLTGSRQGGATLFTEAQFDGAVAALGRHLESIQAKQAA